jgi:hypothetical protein
MEHDGYVDYYDKLDMVIIVMLINDNQVIAIEYV